MIEFYLLIAIMNSNQDIYNVNDYKDLKECSIAAELDEYRDKDDTWSYLCKKVTVNITKDN